MEKREKEESKAEIERLKPAKTKRQKKERLSWVQ